MAIEHESRTLKAIWQKADGSKHTQSFSGIDPEAVETPMQSFFNVLERLSTETLKGRECHDAYEMSDED